MNASQSRPSLDKPEPFTLEETTKPVALANVRAELVREIGMRRKVYPKWCQEGRNGMTREEGAQRIAGMESALRLFDGLVGLAAAAQGLRDAVMLDSLPFGDTVTVERVRLMRGVEMLDAAMARFDRYKVEPRTAHAPIETAELQRDFR